MIDIEVLKKICQLVRYFILKSTTAAGSGHPTSSLSAVELMVTLMFGSPPASTRGEPAGGFHYDVDNPQNPNNDRLIFSKGHAAPLLYSLWAAAGKVSETELLTLRQFTSPLEGHPTLRFKYTEVATGSLGQGLSVGVGMAMNAKYLDRLPYKTLVLLGDSEMSEGSGWEAIQLATHYKLDNLIGIIDVNRLGQTRETMYGHNLEAYQQRLEAFGWYTVIINDGHNIDQIIKAYEMALSLKGKPIMIIAKTVKGKGVSFLENKDGWHGKTLSETQLEQALDELGEIDKKIRGQIAAPENIAPARPVLEPAAEFEEDYETPIATRQAYGHALVELYPKYPEIVVLDAEVSNSTYSQTFKKAYPSRFFEMFIAEQNMVSTALGLSLRGKIPFVSTFASFFSRALDQIRVCQYSAANVNFVGSHVGVSIGPDGPTQMGLEDIAIFRSVIDSVVFYPADHVSEEKLVEAMIKRKGICYMRTTRMETAPIYQPEEEFKIGGSKVLRSSTTDNVTVVAAGITLYEALKAYDELLQSGINLRIIDLYSIKPVDEDTLKKAAFDTDHIITVEDHFAAGGLGEAVMSALSDQPTPIYQLAVRKMPRSGTPQELLDYEEISAAAIVKKVKEIMAFQ